MVVMPVSHRVEQGNCVGPSGFRTLTAVVLCLYRNKHVFNYCTWIWHTGKIPGTGYRL